MLSRFLRLDPINFLSTTILFCILRMVVPHINYTFLPLLFAFFLFTLYHFSKENISESLIVFMKYNYLLLLTSLLVLTGNILSGKIIFFAFKEFLNAVVVLFFAFSLFQFIKTKSSFEKFTWIFTKQLLLLSVIVSCLGLVKYLLQLKGINLSVLIPFYQFGTSLNTDYNFNVLFSFLGIIAIAFSYKEISRVKIYSFLAILFLNIIFSGSRRGLVFLIIFLIIASSWYIYKNTELRKIILRIILFIAFLFTLVWMIIIYRERYTVIKKNQSLDLLANSPAQKTISQIAFRYFTFINSEKSSYELYLDLWAPNRLKGFSDFSKNYIKRDSNNLIYNGNFKYGLKFWYPESSKVRHEIINTPFGNGVRVSKIGEDTSGWPLLYTGRDIIFYTGHTYQLKFKYRVLKGTGNPFKIGFNINDQILGVGRSSNLYTYISDLDNNWKLGVCFFTFWKSWNEVPFFMNNQDGNTTVDFADISLRDLNIVDSLPEFSDMVSSDRSKINMFLKKYDSTFYINKRRPGNENTNLVYNGDFSEGTRFWLPAASATVHKIIETPYGKGLEVIRNNGDNGYWSLQYCGRPIIYHAGHTYQISFFYRVKKGTGLPFNIGWWIEDSISRDRSFCIPLKLTKQTNGWTHAEGSYKFKKDQYDPPAFLNNLQDSTEIEIARVQMQDHDKINGLPVFVDELYNINEEKANIKNKKELSFTDIHSGFYGSRFDRWKYSQVIFIDSMSLKNKLLGGGFDYIYKFGRKFKEGEIDYPHNPFLSTVIFSGLIGLLFYLWYIFTVIILYIRGSRRHMFFFISFVIVFCFSFVSSNTHFSVPVFAILCIIPFLTNSILDLESKGQSDNQPI